MAYHVYHVSRCRFPVHHWSPFHLRWGSVFSFPRTSLGEPQGAPQKYWLRSPYFFPIRQGHCIVMNFSCTEPQSQDPEKSPKIKGHATRMLTQEKKIHRKNHWGFPEGWNGSPPDFITVSLLLLEQ